MSGKLSESLPASPAPTAVRYGVLLFLCSLALLLYIDRVCIGQAAQAICRELKLSKTQFGFVNIAFTIAYCLFEVHTGNWGDRFGSRRVIARIVLWWSAFTALTGAAMGLWSLIAFRFLFGAGEAGAFPNAARVVTRWFPPHERGFARGAITTTSQLGGAITPPLAAWLIVLAGWRWTFAIFGLLGVGWAAAFYWWFRDEPSEHSAVSPTELAHIGSTEAAGGKGHPPIPWRLVASSPNVWLLGTIMSVGAALFYLLFQWFPTYLKEVHDLAEQQSGWYTGLVIGGGAAGCVAGGWLSDLVLRRTSDRRWPRRSIGCGMLGLSAFSMFCFGYCEQAWSATLACAIALFCLQVSIPTWWTVVAEISGEHGAAMFGLMNGLGGVGILIMNLLVGPIVEARQASGILKIEVWQPVFAGVAIALSAGAICWLGVDATRSIVAGEPPPGPAE